MNAAGTQAFGYQCSKLSSLSHVLTGLAVLGSVNEEARESDV